MKTVLPNQWCVGQASLLELLLSWFEEIHSKVYFWIQTRNLLLCENPIVLLVSTEIGQKIQKQNSYAKDS